MNAARLVHPGFWFGRSDIKEAEKLAEMGVGGFCIYWGTQKEIEHFAKRMRDLSPYPDLLISADYEDGLGRWVKGAELLPSNMAIGASGSEELALKKGLITARQARSLGVNWVHAPVVDLATEPQNPIVNTRAFGSNPALISKLAGAFMIGMSQGGVLNSLKHFPGHGATSTDSHLAVPQINKTFNELMDLDLVPYKNLLRYADAIMVGHLYIPSVDDENVSSLSSKTIRDLLIKRLNYKGCVVTDALCMGAISSDDVAVKAFKAGADIILVPKEPFKAVEKLAEFAAQSPEWKEEIISSLATQEILLNKIAKAEVKSVDTAFHKDAFCASAAPKCITALGKEIQYKKGDKVHFLVFDNDDFLQTPFARAMAAAGVHLAPFNGVQAEELLIISYNAYNSFKGHINFNTKQKHDLTSALKHAERSVFVSFGSPFVHDGFVKKVKYSLLCYTQAEEFQTAAALCLSGKITPTGVLPVEIK